MKTPLFVICSFLFCISLDADALAPARKAQTNSIVSERDPSIRIEVPEAAHYIGADRWHLYDVADCEIHVFVEADNQKNVKRYYWIQFEAYLPEFPHKTYNYKLGSNEIIDGLEFNVRARFGPTSEQPQPGSDYEHVRRLIANAGYNLPTDMMNVRFAHLLDASKRKEMLVFFTEDMAPTGYGFSDLIADGKTRPEWTAVESALIDRAKARIRFLPQK
jgi:hypothetical protein